MADGVGYAGCVEERSTTKGIKVHEVTRGTREECKKLFGVLLRL